MHLNLIQKYFNPEHILDIGGHTGEFFSLAKQFFPYADIFVVEGNKDCEPYLKELNTPYLIRLLGSEKKKTVFYKNKQDLISTGNSIYREVTPHFSDENLIKEEIQQYTIDTTFKEADFDLIKLDTQGSEIDILKGGKRIAKKAKGILMEVSVEKYNEGSPLYNEIVDFMDRYGFLEKETLAEYESVTEYNLKVHQKDILFINKNLI
jgi:FkbM family methyltransferase